MKCKVFTIHLAEETRNLEEVKFNKFLEGVSVGQTFAQIINNEYWSILVFYDDVSTARSQTENYVETQNKPQPAIRSPKPIIETPAPEPVILNTQEEAVFMALREWRNERANQDGLPPYMIAHNDSLMQIAKSHIETKEELIQIKGFGEKRADKYGDEILDILKMQESVSND